MKSTKRDLEKIYANESIEFEKLRKTLLKEVKLSAKKRGVGLDWFRYAEKRGDTYRIVLNKSEQYRWLLKVASAAKLRNPDFTSGEIAQELSLLVNISSRKHI